VAFEVDVSEPRFIFEIGPLMVDISASVKATPDAWAKVGPGDTISENGLTFRILELDTKSKPETMKMVWDGVMPKGWD
jgi:hypothetical protein